MVKMGDGGMMRTGGRSVNRRTILLSAVCFALTAWSSGPAAANEVTDRFKPAAMQSVKPVDHATWDRLLKKYVVTDEDSLNRVRYQAFKSADHATLKSYIQALERVKPAGLTRPEQFAYWSNLYNAKTIDIILDHYPVETIRDIAINEGLVGFLKRTVGAGGPWKAKVVTIDGERLSLDNIEHDILRPIFKDPRVHYAVNCASIGCPNLQREAFTAANLEALLDQGARDFVNSPRGFRFQGGGVWASSIYNWFKADFGGTDNAVLAHAAKYAAPDRAEKLKAAGDIDAFGYDWRLNDAKPAVAAKTE
jgi:predicted transcriptional regulator